MILLVSVLYCKTVSSVSSVYDPLGFAAPFILVGKQLLQQLCCDNKGWDTGISQEQRNLWEQWRGELPFLATVKVKGCFKPKSFEKIFDEQAVVRWTNVFVETRRALGIIKWPFPYQRR